MRPLKAAVKVAVQTGSAACQKPELAAAGCRFPLFICVWFGCAVA